MRTVSPWAGMIGIERNYKARRSAVQTQADVGAGEGEVRLGLMPLAVPLGLLPLTWVDMVICSKIDSSDDLRLLLYGQGVYEGEQHLLGIPELAYLLTCLRA